MLTHHPPGGSLPPGPWLSAGGCGPQEMRLAGCQPASAFFMNFAFLVLCSGNCTYFPCFPSAQLLPLHLPAEASRGGSEEDELIVKEGIQVSLWAKGRPFSPLATPRGLLRVLTSLSIDTLATKPPQLSQNSGCWDYCLAQH